MINDTLGHGIGDLLLKKVADRLVSACRKGDVVARLGGDEFVVLQGGVREAADAEKLAARIVDLVGRTYVLSGHTINIGASVGVALQGSVTQARDMLRNGDLALYEAKRAVAVDTGCSRPAWTNSCTSGGRWRSTCAGRWR